MIDIGRMIKIGINRIANRGLPAHWLYNRRGYSMNIYIQKLLSVSVANKYTTWYCNIINNALARNELTGYSEIHHILPQSFQMGGEKDPLNLVRLTSREHFVCHRLLVKMLDSKSLRLKMTCAVLYMAYGNGQVPKHLPPSIVLDQIRQALSDIKKGTSGKKWTDAQRLKLKNRIPHNKGVCMSEAAKENLRQKRMLQKIGPRSESTKIKISKSLKGQSVGLKCWHNGIIMIKSQYCPGPDWQRGTLAKSVAHTKWWTDGENNRRSDIAPGPSWYLGRTKKLH